MRRVASVALIIGIATAVCQTAWAQDPIHKAGRGVVNVLTGWIEIPKQIQLGTQEQNPVLGAGRGAVKGVGLTLLRGGVGIYEALTFPLPIPRAYGSPYEPMELPDYAWE